jgi:hypothetical protein
LVNKRTISTSMKSQTGNKAMFLIRSALLIMLFSASSCIKDMINQVELPKSYSPDFALPVGKTTLTVNNTFYNYVADTNPLPDSLAVYFNNTMYIVDSSDLDMVDLLPFAFKSFTSNSNSIQSLLFRINAENGYPSTSIYQIYLLDAGHTVLDSLLEGKGVYLDPGTYVNDSTITKTHNRRDIVFTSDRIQKIKDVEHLRIKSALVVTKNSMDTLRLFPAYYVDVQIGVRIKLNVNPDSAMNTFQNFNKQ